jgi:hypothetical protein
MDYGTSNVCKNPTVLKGEAKGQTTPKVISIFYCRIDLNSRCETTITFERSRNILQSLRKKRELEGYPTDVALGCSYLPVPKFQPTFQDLISQLFSARGALTKLRKAICQMKTANPNLLPDYFNRSARQRNKLY